MAINVASASQYTKQYKSFECGFNSCCRFTECSKVWTETTDYFQVVGIILGQLLVGFLGDWLGRRWGMIQVSESTKIARFSDRCNQPLPDMNDRFVCASEDHYDMDVRQGLQTIPGSTWHVWSSMFATAA